MTPIDPHPRIRTCLRAVVPLLFVALAAGVVGGCTEEPSAAQPTDSCRSIVGNAADASQIEAQITLLDTALVVCRSYEAFDAEMSRYPSIIGFDVATYVARRCVSADDADVRNSTICTTTVTTTTSTTVPPPPDVFYLGTTLDGREITIYPDADTPFVGDKPQAIVHIVNIAQEDGCPGIELERQRWAALVSDPTIGDEASVYAQHAINVAALFGC